MGTAALSSHVEARRSQATAAAEEWRTLASAEHLTAVLRKAEAACGGAEPASAATTGLEISAAWRRLLSDAASRPERLRAWSEILSRFRAAAEEPGCGPPFGLAAAAVESFAAVERRELGRADRLVRPGGFAPALLAACAALLGAVAAAAAAVRGHLRERERREAEQRRALELQQQLMGIVGHDLRTPLNAIAGSAALLARAPDLPSARARAAQRIVSSAARMSGLVRDLLDFTRLRVTGGFAVEPAPADLGDIARRVVQEVRTAWPRSDIRLEEAGALEGRWDAERLEQVLSNLVGNACHHGQPGAPVLVRLAGAGGAVRAEVINAGPPIPADTLPHIFEPFRRGTRHDASGGVGLGLFIVRSLVEAHGGSIAVATGAEGTTFTVVLPRAAPGGAHP